MSVDDVAHLRSRPFTDHDDDVGSTQDCKIKGVVQTVTCRVWHCDSSLQPHHSRSGAVVDKQWRVKKGLPSTSRALTTSTSSSRVFNELTCEELARMKTKCEAEWLFTSDNVNMTLASEIKQHNVELYELRTQLAQNKGCGDTLIFKTKNNTRNSFRT